ncbi:MAG: 30S ribosomal protein S12 methylthiotransferase accessory factor YcaO [Halothiobacillus sp.]
MSEHTFITGKDAALEDTIARIQGALAALGFEIEETRWLNPVPHCWSVHIRDTHCPILFTNGKGASKKAALASALGEFVERLASQYFFGDFHWHRGRTAHGTHDPKERWFTINQPGMRPDGLLDEALWRHFEADAYRVTTADWQDFNSTVEDALCALPFTRMRDGHTLYFPANVVGNLYVSNGLTAGNTVFEARTQGLSEVFERFVKNRVISEGLALPQIPDEVVAAYPHIAAAINALRGHGFGLRLMDASLGGQFPVICVTLIDPKTRGVFASFGAHPSFEVAFERTVTELLQGRALDDLHGFHPPTTDRELVCDPQNLELHFIDSSGWLAWHFFRDTPDFAFVHWDFTAENNEAGFTRLCAIVQAQGFDVYVADYPHVGLYACRILVPGMSEVYPVDELYERNNTQGRALVPFVERLQELTAAERGQLFEAIEALDLDWLMPVTDVIGLAADRGSPWESLRIGELRALALFSQANFDDGDEREALLDWLATVPPIPEERTAIYQAAAMLNQLQMANLTPASDYASTLALMYNAPTRTAAQRLLDGTAGFLNIPSLGAHYAHSAAHQTLMAAFNRAYAAKTITG